jgi:SAM-dependent methyltransferase
MLKFTRYHLVGIQDNNIIRDDAFVLAAKRRCKQIYRQTIEPLYPRDSVPSYWLDNVVGEILFWYLTIATDGNDWKDSYQMRFELNRKNQFSEFLNQFEEANLSLLDVGAGALTAIGNMFEGKNLEIVVTDALAPAYNLIFSDFGIIPPSPVLHCDAEKLLKQFGTNRFHFVYASNCIDHCYDPVLAIKNMVAVLKPNGMIVLGHQENVAIQENYTGLHQWNLSLENGLLVIWNKKNKYLLSNELPENISIESSVNAGWLNTMIRKNIDGMPLFPNFKTY